MGEIAEDMVDGTCCMECGCYFQDSEGHLFTHGYPVICKECWPELTPAEKKDHTEATAETM